MGNTVGHGEGRGAWTRERLYCAVVGLFLLVRAVTTLLGGASFGAPGDGWRAVFQLLIVLLLIPGIATSTLARRAALLVGGVYVAITVLGLIGGHDVLGVIPVDMRDKVVHPLIALVAALACVRLRRRAVPASPLR